MGRTDIATSEAPPDQDANHQMERLVGVGVSWKLLGQVWAQGIRLATVAILARLLTPADYGAAAIAIALATFAPTVADMGMGSALVQIDKATQRVRSTTFWATLAFGIGLSALLAASAATLGRFVGDPQVGKMVAVGGLAFAICSIGSTSQAVFMREMRFRSIELRYWFAVFLASVLAVVAATLGAGAWALVLQQIILLATFAAALWWRPAWRPTFDFSRATFRELSSFGIRIAGGRWARLIELLVLFLLVGKLLGVPALGAWTFAMSMVILPLTVIAIPIAEVLFSAFSRLRGERERLAALWLESVRYLAAVTLPLLVGLAVAAPDLVPTVFGSRWEVSVGIIQILCVYVMVRSLQSWGSVLLDAVGRPQVTLWTQLAALCTTTIGVIIGAQWSIEAVAVGFVLSQLIAVEIPMLIIVLSELRISLRSLAARLSGVVAATLVMGTICLVERLALSALGVGLHERAALTIGLALLVYAISLWWLAPDISRRAIGIGRKLLARAATPPAEPTRIRPRLRAAPRPALTPLGGRKKVTREGERFGFIVAVRRTELGLSQADLATRMHMSPSTVVRIEAGQTPSTEARKRLGAVLDGEPAADGVRLSVARPATIGTGARTPREPLDRRRFWGGLAIAVLVPLLVILGVRISSGGGDDPSPQSLQAVTAVPTVVAAVEQAQEQALLVAAQEAKEARAAKAAERKEAAAARKEAAAARKEAAAAREEEASATPTSSDEGSSEVLPAPVSAPVTSSPPAPTSSGGGSKSPPQLQHGVLGGGG